MANEVVISRYEPSSQGISAERRVNTLIVPALNFDYNKRMFYVYLIQSQKTNELYVGYTAGYRKRIPRIMAR